MAEGGTDPDDPEYQRVFTALDELKLGFLKSYFKEQCLRDETLFYMRSEGELRAILIKELEPPLPFGHGFAFSRLWFQKYHGRAEQVLTSHSKSEVTDKDSAKEPQREDKRNDEKPEAKTVSLHEKKESSGLHVTVDSETENAARRKTAFSSQKQTTIDGSGSDDRMSPQKEREDPADEQTVNEENLADQVMTKEADSTSTSGEGHVIKDPDEPTVAKDVTTNQRLPSGNHTQGTKESAPVENPSKEEEAESTLPEYAELLSGHQSSANKTEEKEKKKSKPTAAEKRKESALTSHSKSGVVHKDSAKEPQQEDKRNDEKPEAKTVSLHEKKESSGLHVTVDSETEHSARRKTAFSSQKQTTIDGSGSDDRMSPQKEREDPTNRQTVNEENLADQATIKEADIASTSGDGHVIKGPEECIKQELTAVKDVTTTRRDLFGHHTQSTKESAAVEIPKKEEEAESTLPSQHFSSNKRGRKSDKKKRKEKNKTTSKGEERKSLEGSASIAVDSEPSLLGNGPENEPGNELEKRAVHDDAERYESMTIEKESRITDDPPFTSAETLRAISITAGAKVGEEECLRDQGVSDEMESCERRPHDTDNSTSVVQMSSSCTIPENGTLHLKERSQVCQEREPVGEDCPVEEGDLQEDSGKVQRCIPRPLGEDGRNTSYAEGYVLDAEENREVEFKKMTGARPSTLPWKIMEKAKKFICACLNADEKGIIYFGIGDCQEQDSKFKRGEVLGLQVEDVMDEVVKAFQFVLDDHMKSDAGPLQKGGEQHCINLVFVPVMSQGSRTKKYVIEIEVVRDWKFCKDNIYYSKTWTEKRDTRNVKDCIPKKALSDFYKVHQEEFDDVAIRTNGASNSVKQHEVIRQVKEPLTAKYKEWKRNLKLAETNDSMDEVTFDEGDVKKFSKVVRERLRELNFKDYKYILVANKLHPQYRGTPHLAFLQNIPWVAVFDLFDASSKKDGLHHVCNETTDAPRAKVRSLDDFKDVLPDKDFPMSIRGTTWILNDEEMQKGDWIKCSKDCLYRALSAYKQCFPSGKLSCVFLGLSESAVQEMSDIMECCFSIFGNLASNCVTIISESKSVAEGFLKASKPSLQKELKDCSISGLPWALLKEIVREMVGPSKFEERGATTELPYFNGGFKAILNKVILSWDDLEVYSRNPRLPTLAEVIAKERDAFYKGTQISQINLFHSHSIPRSLERELNAKVDRALKSLSKASSDPNCHVKTVTVPYEPGSGATTLCRTILWNKRKDYRCAVVKAITTTTDFQIHKLQSTAYDETNSNYSPPALVLVDNFPENDAKHLTERIMKRGTKCVVLTTLSIANSNTQCHFDITPLRKLDETETALVKNVLINITSDTQRRREAEEVLEREKRFIWLGLELFGREYLNIEEKLQEHISSILAVVGNSQRIYKMLLNLCCFLHKYSDGCAILPHSVVIDYLYETCSWTKEQCSEMHNVHEIFGGLLLEGLNETNGYYGWRPAHSLVSEVGMSTISIEDTAVRILENVCKGKAYAIKFLRQQVYRLFLDRKRISDPLLLKEQGTEDDFENDVQGFYEVRTRYSPVIMDILEREESIPGALRLLITLCEEATQIEDKAYAWQQLARFIGYEMRAKVLDNEDVLHKGLYTTMTSGIKEGSKKLPMPTTGIEAAHVAINIAISHQPTYGHHYVTKGGLYQLQLRDFKKEDQPNFVSSMPDVIEICCKALEVYNKAVGTSHAFNDYPLIGKIQTIVLLLEIVKALPCFHLEGESFTKYLKKGEIPREMRDVLSQEHQNFVQSLSSTTLDLLNGLFGDVKLRQTTSYDENELRALNNAKIRASNLRRTFYKITGFDRRELSEVEGRMPLSSSTQGSALHQQQMVQDILFIHDETPYSAWSKLQDKDVNLIYSLLKAPCLRGHGSNNDMLICSKACLRLKTRPPVQELCEIVSKWVAKFPNSEWAHLFNYMIHFPISSGTLAANTPSTKASIKECDRIVREKKGIGFRKAGAEYFLGKGIGLNAIVSGQESWWPERKWQSKTDFWRSRETSERLERVCGQKDVSFKGIVTYQGIQLHFDDTLYPNESKDDLWFYIGFSVAGPYAYDPVDKDTYAFLGRQSEESILSTHPSSGASTVSVGNVSTFAGSLTKGKPRALGARAKQSHSVSRSDGPKFSVLSRETDPRSSQSLQKPMSSSLPHLLNAVPEDTPAVSNRLGDFQLFSSASSNNLSQQLTSSQSSYSSTLQYGSRGEGEALRHAGSRLTGEKAPKKIDNWKGVVKEGVRGKGKQCFSPQYIHPQTGKIHHGAFVYGTRKSQECRVHTKYYRRATDTSECNFAHSWKGDTLQFVCTKCTEEGKTYCKEKIKHQEFIWNLGPYCTASGNTWKESNS